MRPSTAQNKRRTHAPVFSTLPFSLAPHKEPDRERVTNFRKEESRWLPSQVTAATTQRTFYHVISLSSALLGKNRSGAGITVAPLGQRTAYVGYSGGRVGQQGGPWRSFRKSIGQTGVSRFESGPRIGAIEGIYKNGNLNGPKKKEQTHVLYRIIRSLGGGERRGEGRQTHH